MFFAVNICSVTLLLLLFILSVEYVSSAQKSLTHHFKIEIEGILYELHLRPRDTEIFKNVPIWTLNSNGLDYKGILDGNDIICEDIAMDATLMPLQINSHMSGCNTKYYTGVFGRNVTQYVVKMEDKLHKDRKKRFIVSMIKQMTGVFGYHEISLLMNKIHKLKIRHVLKQKKYSKLNVNLLVVIDYALYKKLGRDHRYIVKYMNILWSAVDLKFRKINEPNIHFKISNLVIVEEQHILNYTDHSGFDGLENTINMDLALNNFGEIKQFFKNSNITYYDAVVTMTGLYGLTEDYYECFGMAFRKGVCNPLMNGAIVYDDGNFFGINNNIHELGHLLGLKHDGYAEDEEFKKCGYESQKPGVHTIMLPEGFGAYNEYIWSQCSIKYFHSLKEDEEMSCIGKE